MERTMNPMRGVLLILAGCIALSRLLVIHHGPRMWMALGLGVAAIALGAWRLTRKSAR
jgi:hypothetical protein